MPENISLARPRVLRQIGLPPKAPVTLVIAPAGYGKTTAVVQWAQAASHPVYWIALQEDDNDPDGFLRHLLAAIEPANDGTSESPLTIGQVLASIATRAPSTIVFDDCHIVTNALVHKMWRELVDQLSSGISLMLLGRTAPPLALSKLRSRGIVRDIGIEALRFTDDEVREFLRHIQPEPLNEAQVRSLVEKADGWPIWLCFAGQEIATLGGAPPVNRAWGHGAASLVDAYFREELLDRIDPELAAFMLDVADLPLLQGDLVSTVLEQDAYHLLHRVAHECIWAVPLDEQGVTYRFPAALRDSLKRLGRHRTRETARRARMRRAIDWFEQHGDTALALDLCVTARAWDRARALLINEARSLFESGKMPGVLKCLGQLPPAEVLRHRDLGFWFIVATMLECRDKEARAMLACVEQTWLEGGDAECAARLRLCRSLIALREHDRTAAIDQATAAMPDLPASERSWARLVLWVCGLRADASNLVATRQGARGNRELWETPWWDRVVMPAYTNHLVQLGDITGAVAQCRRRLRIPGECENEARLQLALMAMMRYDLAEAEAQLTLIDQDLPMGRLDFALDVRLAIGRVQQYRGQLAEAGTTLASVRRDAFLSVRPGALQHVQTAQADLWLALGRMDAVQRWEAKASPVDASLPHWFGDVCPHMVVAKLRLQEGAPAAARELLVRLIELSHVQLRESILPEVYVTLAMAHLALDAPGDAQAAMEQALARGESGSIRLPFLLAGVDLLPLLHRVNPGVVSRVYIDGLVHLLQAQMRQPGALVLTAREREVLELVSDGCANKEIAQRLFVSKYTVKNHLVNIGRKLSTGTRAAAVTRARQLGLLQPVPGTWQPADAVQQAG